MVLVFDDFDPRWFSFGSDATVDPVPKLSNVFWPEMGWNKSLTDTLLLYSIENAFGEQSLEFDSYLRYSEVPFYRSDVSLLNYHCSFITKK